ncbi:MAG TPA: serine/threonine protein kinase, partial [Polyangiaceae bacterium]
MGDVWEATHSVTGRSVAIKCLRTPRNAGPTSAGRARFMLEAQAACAVDHPNVVEILDFVEA